MRKIFNVIVLLAAATLAQGIKAQQMPPIPVDANVRIGHLDNGLTYYIRHNEEPKGQACFYIAQKVGSVLEEEEQRGLAHFLEHMCFNGTEHFRGNGVIKYCESIGVQFGADLNAYTSIDETVYNIDNVPVAKIPSSVDSCLYILHDWADGLLLTADDIDHERGVIHEEWRSRLNAQMRQYEKMLPVIYPDGNRYGHRLPIGLLEVIDNFPYQAIRDYYEKWYRPDQQGIVVVGDIDVNEIEAKIKAIFSPIQMPENPAERVYFEVPDNKEPIICITTDKEQPYALSYLFLKHDAVPNEMKTDLSYWVISYCNQMISMLFDQRLTELANLPQPPFVQAAIEDDDYFLAVTKKALTGIAVNNGDDFLNGLTTVYREILRAARHGFTASEYERMRAEYMTQMETAYNQRDKRSNSVFCSQYVRHFIQNEPIPGIENGYVLAQQLVPNIPVDVINGYLAELVSDSNLVVACNLPEKEGVTYPTEDELKAIVAAVATEDIAAYEDKVSDEPLISKELKSKKVKAAKGTMFGYEHIRLANGVNVYLKQTDFNADQILMEAYSMGGQSQYGEEDILNMQSADELMTIGGVGNFSLVELNKALAGKSVSLTASIGQYSEYVNGQSTVKDFETMLQLTYLYATALRQDDEAFESWKNKTRAILLNAEVNPMRAFQDSLSITIYDRNPRAVNMKAADLDKVDYGRTLQICRERFANAADFNFVFTGSFDREVIVPLIAKYLGNLPAKGKKEEAKKVGLAYVSGEHVCDFEREMEVPMATVFFFKSGRLPYTLKNNLTLDILSRTLDIVYTEEIREKEGGTYGVGVSCGMTDQPEWQTALQIVYQTDPAKCDYLNGRIGQILNDFVKNGPSEENLNKAKDNMIKNHIANLRENDYYTTAMTEWLRTGMNTLDSYEETLNSITVEDVRVFAEQLISQGNSTGVIMRGKSAAAGN